MCDFTHAFGVVTVICNVEGNNKSTKRRTFDNKDKPLKENKGVSFVVVTRLHGKLKTLCMKCSAARKYTK